MSNLYYQVSNGTSPSGDTPGILSSENRGSVLSKSLLSLLAMAFFLLVGNVAHAQLAATLFVDQDVTCNGGTDGIIRVTASGGPVPYSYAWSDGATSDQNTSDGTAAPDGSTFSLFGSTRTGVSAGVYSVTVTDNAAGTATSLSVTVTQPGAISIDAISGTNLSCNGDGSGAVATTVSGGTPPYTYTWSGPNSIGNVGSATGLDAGVYSVTVTDSENCPAATASVTLTEPTSLSGSVSSIVDQSEPCLNNGQIDITVTGGTPPYSFSWDNGATTEDLTGLAPGAYSVTITDANGCSENIGPETVAAAPAIVITTNSQTNVGCAGDATGALDITASGGVGGYTYAWDNGLSSGPTHSGLTAGDYNVTVTSGSCSETTTVTITEPANGLSISQDAANTADIDCNGGTASAGVSVSGGTSPYQYTWSGTTAIGDVANATGLAAGVYNVTVEDALGCEAVLATAFTFTEPAALTAGVSGAVTNASCNGGAGSVTITASGGTAPLVWGEPLLAAGSANTIVGGTFTVTATAGVYAFQVQDDNGCGPVTVNVTITEPDAITASATVTNVTCNGAGNGSIDLSVSGGTAPYQYLWSTSGTPEDLTALDPGTYTVTITDAEQCTEVASYTVVEPTTLNLSASQTDISCAGVSSGSIDLTVADGTPPYDITWSNGATTEDISGLVAGTYSVTVDDVNLCGPVSASYTISEPTTLTVFATSGGTDVSCNGGNDGAIDLNVSGGTPPYSYMWNTGASTEDLSGLTAGAYNVAVSDDNGCMQSLAVSISEPDAITSASLETSISCNGAADGSISVTVSGGTTPYTYEWSNSLSAGTVHTGLGAGTYNLTVTDDNLCVENFSYTIDEPAVLAVNVTPGSPNCPGDFASATASVSGGTAPYTYLWSTGGIGATETGLLAAGSPYTVTVTDARGCTGQESVTIVDPTPVSVTIDATDITCFGDNPPSGSAVASASGGTGGYSYEWDNLETGANISNLSAGTYTVTATDDNGCTASATVTITEPAELTVRVNSVTDAPCFGENGAVALDVNGGTQFTGAPGEPSNPNGYPYIYSWSGGATTINDHIADGVPAGNYTIVVTDRNGCTASTTVSVGEPALLEATATGTDPSCNGASDGTASVAVVGGTSPYSYSWSNVSTLQSLTGLAANTYTVTVTDANGCTATDMVTLVDPAALAIAGATVKNSCNPGTDGAVTLSVSGGTGPYTYMWSDGQTSNPATGLAAGTYSVTVDDANGCGPVGASYTITQPAAPLEVANFNRVDVTCAGGMDGEIDQGGTTGGTPPYTYLWSNAATTEDISNIGAGNYSLTVTDAVGCTVVYLNIIINEPAAITVVNDAANKTDLDCNGDTDAFISVTASGGTGALSYAWSNGVNGQSISGMPGDVYTLDVTDANGCVESFSYTVTEPAAITATSSSTNPSCASGSGVINVTISGGTPNYSYAWSNGTTGSTAGPISLTAGNGTYGLVVTDARGCVYNDSYTLTAPAAIAIAETVTPTSCNSTSATYTPNGSVSVVVTGGTAPYVYSWNGGATTTSSSISGLAAGATGNVVVTDANGCSATKSYSVGEAPAVTVVENIVNNTACAKGTAGEIHITASGGTGALTYAWEGPNGPVAGTTDLLNLVSGSYTVTISDANGCDFDFNYFVADGSDPATLALTLGDVTCNGANDGSVTIEVTSGTGPYIVTVTDGSGTVIYNQLTSTPFVPIVLNNLSPDTYSVAVIDQNGCPAAGATAIITEPTKLVTSVVSTSDASCFGLADGSFTFNIDQGTQPYDMVWSNGTTTGMLTGLSDNTNPGTAWQGTISGLAAGTYDITVTDAKGCEELDQAVIGQPSDLNITFTEKDDIDCFGDTTGSAVANISGGSGVYTYQWYSGQYPGAITPLAGQSGTVVNGMATGVNFGVGFYTIEIDDLVGGCTYYGVFEETGPAPIVVNVVSDASVTCNGGTDATASVTISGGVAPYAWVVSGATNASGSIATDGGSNTFTGLGAGTYFVDVTDANGCTVPQASFVITQPAGLNVVTSADSITCPGGFNATASVVSVSGGIPPYSYLWSTGGTGMSTGVNVDGNLLFAGTYTVAITDATGLCATTVSVDVYEPMPVGGTAVVTDVQCAGDCSTSLIDLTPTGGTAPYTYYWRASVNGVPTGPVLSTVQDPAGLCAGEYTVRINDKYGCEGFATFTIGTATTLVVTGVDTDVLCKGDATGAVDLTVSGGTSPYTYAWDNGETTEDISGLAAGSYDVVVTDANGCSSAAAFVITEPFSNLYASVIDFIHVSCNGGMDGAADIYVVGGTLPYSYMWSNGSMVQDPTDLMAGVNSVTITDANGCQEFLSVTITEPAAALASGVESVTNIGCNGATTGAIDISVSGGTSPYTYAWTSDDPAFSASTQDLSGIPAGVYAVAITDANGCTDGISGIIVTQATGLTAVASATNVNCFGDATGMVSVVVTGGTMPYSYLWSNGATTETVDNLVSGGSYSVDVTDANGCTVTSNTVTITGPASPLAASLVSVQDVYTCFGDNTGFIDISVTGGTTPYSFAWSNGATVQNPQDLFAGGYQVTVSDANGCQTFIKGLVVSQPSQLLATVAKSTDVDCNGATTGSIDLAPAGGTAPYSFNWSNGVNTEDLSNLGAGTYSVTVTDANGCTANNTVVITEPAILAVTIDMTSNPDCNSGANGMIMTSVTGGAMPYTITWSDGVTGIEDRTGLAAGVYIINVTDACGATVSASTTLTEPSLLTATTVVTDVDCFGATNGAVDVTVTGGTMPYTYNWGGGITSEDRTNLAPGTYTVIITDANGCSTTASAVVNGPASPINVSAVVTDVLCFGDATGAIDITVTGGTSPYSFSWSNGDNTEDLSNIPAGSYTGTVTDAAGCTFSATLTVAGPASALAASAVVTDVLCNGASTGMIDLTVTGGTAPYTYNWSNGANTQDLMNVPAGSYTGTVTDANGCSISATIAITEPATGITISNAVVTNVSCNGGTDGAVDITVTGGTPPYSYSWSNGAISQDLSNVPAGIYSGVITDANGCTFTASVTVGQPAALVAATTVTNVNCFGDATGTVDLTVTGGTAPYSYAWSNGANTEDLLNVVAGSYNVVITDANGCVVNASAAITQNSAIATSIVQSNVDCFGGSDGSASLNVSGGTPPYTIAWNTGDNTQNINNLSAGTYSVVVTDANGCTANNSVIISEPTELTVTAVYDAGTSASSAVANVSGGTPPYSYQWNSVPAQFTQTAVSLPNGTYSVVVTDANGCSQVSSVLVDQSPISGVGIEEPALSEMISLYPNPTSDVVFVGYEFSSEQNLEINVVNGLGQVVMSTTEANALTGKVRLDVADLANGVYYVVISNGTDSDNRRLVIQK